MPPAPPKPPAPKAPKAPRKPSPVPPCENPTQVLALAATWQEAFRVAFGASYLRPLFRDARPWESGDARVLRRWTDAVRLDARLAEQGTDPREFCTAVAEHFKWRSARAGRRVLTTMRQVGGDYGRGIWERWREKRKEEGGFQPGQQEDRVHAAATAGTSSQAESLVRDIRNAWRTCAYEGAEYSVTCLWRAEVLWLLATTEPHAREAVSYALAADTVYGPTRLAEIKLIRGNQARQGWLTKLRREALGFLHPCLQAEGGHA